jgi:hypothetical protein
VLSIPSDPAAARESVPWIAFEGRWGERQEAFYNGPTGPNLKRQWTEPITWSGDWRDVSYAVPAGGLLGTEATDFFCGAVESGSNLVLQAVRNPGTTVLMLAVLAVLVVFLLARTPWRPATPLHVARRRSWGQTLAASCRMYASRPLLFLGIGLLAIPISVVVALLQSLLLSATSIVGISPDAEGGGFRVAVALGIGTLFTLLTLGLVQAASARAIAELDAGRDVDVVRSYRLVRDSIRPLLGALTIVVVVVGVLSVSIILLPIAVWLVVRWALVVPTVELEDCRALGALRRSGEPRPPPVAESRNTRRGGRPHRRGGRAAARGAPHPLRRRAVRARQRGRRPRLRSGYAFRWSCDDLRLLRHVCPRTLGRSRAAERAPSGNLSKVCTGICTSRAFRDTSGTHAAWLSQTEFCS